jgi:hypothetical protein
MYGLRRLLLSFVGRLVFLLSKTFRLFGFPTFRPYIDTNDYFVSILVLLYRLYRIRSFFHLILLSYFIDFVSFRYISFSYFTDFVSFRWISFSYFTDFVLFRFLTLQISLDFVFVSFRFFSFLSLPVPCL